MQKVIYLKTEGLKDITEILQRTIYKNKNQKIQINIPKGEFTIHKTIYLCSNTHLKGEAEFDTKLCLASETNDNMFTNHDYENGNHNIEIEDLWLDGNATNQYKPSTEKRLSFCNILYIKEGCDIHLSNIKATNVKQTALHFNNSLNINIRKLIAQHLGWSGISTSGTDNISVIDANIIDSGKDTRHSAVHFDGGVGSYFTGVINGCTGNGIMLDSKFTSLSNSVIKAECNDCKRGIAIFGALKNTLSNVLIRETEVSYNEIGILISNAPDIFISDCNIHDNSQHGIYLHENTFLSNTIIYQSKFNKNNVDINNDFKRDSNYTISSNINFKSEETNKDNISIHMRVIKRIMNIISK